MTATEAYNDWVPKVFWCTAECIIELWLLFQNLFFPFFCGWKRSKSCKISESFKTPNFPKKNPNGFPEGFKPDFVALLSIRNKIIINHFCIATSSKRGGIWSKEMKNFFAFFIPSCFLVNFLVWLTTKNETNATEIFISKIISGASFLPSQRKKLFFQTFAVSARPSWDQQPREQPLRIQKKRGEMF